MQRPSAETTAIIQTAKNTATTNQNLNTIIQILLAGQRQEVHGFSPCGFPSADDYLCATCPLARIRPHQFAVCCAGAEDVNAFSCRPWSHTPSLNVAIFWDGCFGNEVGAEWGAPRHPGSGRASPRVARRPLLVHVNKSVRLLPWASTYSHGSRFSASFRVCLREAICAV